MAEGSEVDTSNSSTSQPGVESIESKTQRLSRPVKKIGLPINTATREKKEKETKIPTCSTPSAVASRSRKIKVNKQDFSKDPKDKAPQSKQDKTGKKPS